ncbi:MAG: HIT family protein [Thermoprotei archaeon]
MSYNCIFCSILSRKADGYIVYEDERVAAILDKFPISPGHTLVMPKVHYSDYLVVDDNDLVHIALVAKKLAKKIKERIGADGVRLLTNVGASAGQVIFHLHVHIIPTWEEGYPNEFKDFVPRKEQPKDYYTKLAQLISS